MSLTCHPYRLVLWDVDHTLIDGAGVSREAYAAAFARVTGKPLRAPAPMAGRTELSIATETLRLNGVEPDHATVRRLAAAMNDEVHARAEDLAAAGRELPGARAALAALARTRGVHQSVLTGNLRSVAELKLKTFGLAEHLDFDCGAYGDDAHERPQLLPYAWRRARTRLGREFGGPETVVIGDTVLDVATAKAGGALAVAVATGRASVAELAASGADFVLPDLRDTAAVAAAVRG
ncbi:HAD family hydrolase [Streptomyces gamaensis]|uniref:HAD family hydrolase n=1 Tax=Streptomyces gamaensis TaxID=1763542 RepID=A0ABW0Z003_9ACTN